MEQLRNYIKVATLLPLAAVDGDNTPIAGDAVDMYQTSDGPAFDGALVLYSVGAVGADVSAVTLTIQEDDDSSFSSPSVAAGGEATSILDGDLEGTMQIKRTKRYIRALVTVTEDGAGDTVEIAATALLNNWAEPYPTVV